ncbi:MAG: YcjF family protein [Pseudomonadota bacterium]
MPENRDGHRAFILGAAPSATGKPDAASLPIPPVILDTAATETAADGEERADSADRPVRPGAGTRRGRSPFPVVLGLLALFLAGVAAWDAYHFLVSVFSSSRILGVFFSGLLLFLTAALFWWGSRTLRDFSRVRDLGTLRTQGTALMERTDDPGLGVAVENYLDTLATHYRDDPGMPARLEAIRDQLDILAAGRDLDGRQRVTEISRGLYKEIDRKAIDLVLLRAQQAALMTAISRLPMADLLIALWRSLALVREVAALYGGRPGNLAVIRLTRHVLYNVIYADLSEVAADGLSQLAGDTVVSVFSAQAAQGVGMGFMIGRLGLQAVKVCRPVPFTGQEETQPSFQALSRAIGSIVKKAAPGKEERGVSDT